MTQSNGQWYYGQNGAQVGPHTLAEMTQLVSACAITRQTLVWSAGMANWSPAGGVAALFDPSAVPPPMPAMPIGYAVPSPRQDIAHDAGMRMLLPVGRSGWAIAAGYAGLFAVLVIFAPVALILGIVALMHLKRRPDLHGKGRAIFGLIMGALFTIPLIFGVIIFVFSKK